jgi:uncharacterized paraquat-inducible protein A
MSAPSVKKLRLCCPNCLVKNEFPSNFTTDDLPLFCDVCQLHQNHELHDPRCPLCVAKLWRTRLQALSILLHGAPAARPDAL